MLRTIDLTSSIVREITSVVAQNIHNESIGEYYYPIPKEWDEHLSFIEVKERKTEQSFEVEKAEFDSLKWVSFLQRIIIIVRSNIIKFSSIVVSIHRKKLNSL